MIGPGLYEAVWLCDLQLGGTCDALWGDLLTSVCAVMGSRGWEKQEDHRVMYSLCVFVCGYESVHACTFDNCTVDFGRGNNSKRDRERVSVRGREREREPYTATERGRENTRQRESGSPSREHLTEAFI